MFKMKDWSTYIGNKYNHWTVIGVGERHGKRQYLTCKCDCGTIRDVKSTSLTCGESLSCGCALVHHKKYTKENMVGRRFERLVVIDEGKGADKWVCRCDCGKVITTSGNGLRTWNTKSCGCYNKDKIRATWKSKRMDLTGQKFGMLTAMYCTGEKFRSSYKWHCKCDCGNEIDVPSCYLRQRQTLSCGHSHGSVGELKIKELLDSLRVKYIREKSFDGCVNSKTGKRYRFDFYVDDRYLIEFDGQQHFYKGWSFSNSLEERQRMDVEKDIWCDKHNIPLIRIPYNEIDSLDARELVPETSEHLIHGWISGFAYLLPV